VGQAIGVDARRGPVALPVKLPLFGVGVSASDSMGEIVGAVMAAAEERRPLMVSALSVHALMTAASRPEMAAAIDAADIVTTDGQPVRWALNALHRVRLRRPLERRICGPDLMLAVCAAASRARTPIFLYGSIDRVLGPLSSRLLGELPRLRIAGTIAPRMRPPGFPPSVDEPADRADVERIRESGARVVFVGLGCPLQEMWAAKHRERLGVPTLCVGAAFDFHAGLRRRAPPAMQRLGLEWLFRLAQDPRRLLRRYADTNTRFLLHLARDLARGG
jgi:exopolysaccharide biosynthesis WecB/TagA/CpsF family protein